MEKKKFVGESVEKQNAQYYGSGRKIFGILHFQCISELELKLTQSEWNSSPRGKIAILQVTFFNLKGEKSN